MVRVGLRKESIKSIIVTKDREFKRKAIAFLNGSAFPAEKFTVESLNEGIGLLESNSDCRNFVWDVTPLNSEDLTKQLESFKLRCRRPDLRVLLYLDVSYQSKDKAQITKLLPTAHLFFLPMEQVHFNRAFHEPKNVPPPQDAHMPTEPVASQAPAKLREPVKELNRDVMTLWEASAHIKETVNMLNDVKHDRSRLETVQKIGQRFNGLIGTFAFLDNHASYEKIIALATIIDDISRTYSHEEAQAITDDHWQLMVESAKCLYLILKDLREGITPAATRIATADSLIQVYEFTDDISKRQLQSQDDIDSLIADEQRKRSS